MSAVRIQIRDDLGNISYLSRTKSGYWNLVSQNGIALGLSNVVGNEPLARFALEDAGDDGEAVLEAIRKYLSGKRTATLLSAGSDSPSKGALSDEEKSDFAWILTETIDLSVDRRDGLAKHEAKTEFESIKRVLDYLEANGADMSVQRRALDTPRF
ncbi:MULTISPECIES: hypothetical protein [Microvirga]|uniref:hypothetical protein n=1 Tax=Microvirga TaxID=186650 RepID=UPI0021C7BF82|nr:MULTISPECIES: hypothetical protein [unclassified Microvirga]